MPMRVGEMMVIVRAQDYATRTLRRVGAEMAGLSRAQALSRSQIRTQVKQAQMLDKIGGAESDRRRMRVIQERNRAEQMMNQTIARRNQLMSTSATAGWTAQGRALGAQAQMLTQRYDRLNAIVDDMPPRFQRLARNTGMLSDALFRNRSMLRGTHDELRFIQEDIDIMNRQNLAAPFERMQRVGHLMTSAGRSMQIFGAASTVAFGLAARSAAEFDTNISLAATQARDLGAGVPQVQKRIDQLTNGISENGVVTDGIIGLMNKYTATQSEMADASFEIFSSMNLQTNGITDVRKGLDLLDKANQIAIAGQEDLGVATNAMITVLNNFDPRLENTTKQFDSMFNIVRFGRMRLRDFDIMMNKIAPTAADAGQSLQNVGGAMAFLTQVMPSQRMVATGISRLIEALRHPAIVAGLHEMGVEAKQANGKLRPLDDLLAEIARKFPEVTTGQKGAADFFMQISALGRGGGRGQIFTAEGRRAFSEIMTHFRQYLQVQGQIELNQEEFKNATAAQMQSLGVQWGKFVNQVRAAGLIIGQDVIPVFGKLGDHIQGMISAFQGIDPETRRMIVQWTAWAGIILLLAGLLTSLGGVIVSMIASLGLMAATSGAATTRVGMLLNTLKGLLRFGGLVLTITAIIKMVKGGDPTAWDLLQGAAGGALLGARFGPAGAAIGAIVVPVMMQINAERNWKENFAQKVREATTDRGDLWRKYGEYVARSIEQGYESAFKNFEEFKNFQQQADKMTNRENNRLEVHAVREREITDAIENKRKKTKKYQDDLDRWYKEQLAASKAVKEQNKELGRAAEQGAEQAVESMRQMYSQLKMDNEQAFGELFQGPFLSSQTFDLAKEWGIEPRIQDMIRDLHMQNAQFATWRNNLDSLFKKGIPTEMIDELRQMGPEQGAPLVENLMKAKPAQINRLIAEWKQRAKQIEDATKMDFRKEIDRFRKAGGDMGQAIINGFRDAGVGAWFDNWVKVNFPDVISAAVTEAVQTAKENMEERGKLRPKPTPPPDKRTGGTKTEDNSTNIKQDIHVSGPGWDDETARRAGWEVANQTARHTNKGKRRSGSRATRQ
jgi:Phage-related minor tail protein